MTKPVLTCSRLNRQVMGVAGAIIISGFISAIVFDNIVGVLVMAFVGLGLFIGGLTGKCGLKLILVHMPWNR